MFSFLKIFLHWDGYSENNAFLRENRAVQNANFNGCLFFNFVLSSLCLDVLQQLPVPKVVEALSKLMTCYAESELTNRNCNYCVSPFVIQNFKNNPFLIQAVVYYIFAVESLQ